MDSVDSKSVSVEPRSAELGTTGTVSAPSWEFDWTSYLDFSEDEAESGLCTILAEEGKLPSFEDAIQDFESQDHPIERNRIQQSAQQHDSPTSPISSESTFAAVCYDDNGLNSTAQSPNRSGNFLALDKSKTPNVVGVEEHHDLNGLAGLFGLTLEEARLGARRSTKKKQDEPIKTRTLCQPARVQKPSSTMTRSASNQRNKHNAGLLPHENFLAGIVKEELERVNAKANPSQPTAGGYSHLAALSTSARTLHQDVQSLVQSDGQLVQQILLARQQCQTTETIQSNQKSQQVQQFQPIQQYNALQGQTQSLLLARQHALHCQSTPQMGLGYETTVYQPHQTAVQQPYHRNWSNVQTHAHPQVQSTAPSSHQQGRAPTNYTYSSPTTQSTAPSLQQIASSPYLRQAETPSHPQVFYPMPQHIVNRSSQMLAPGQKQILLGHHSQISTSPQQAGYNFGQPQFQTQPSPNLVAGYASHGMTHNTRSPPQHVRRPLNAQQQQWFRFYTQGHA